MAKCMFLKKCLLLNLDPVEEFFRLVGKLYKSQKYDDDDVSDDEDIDKIFFIFFFIYYILNVSTYYMLSQVFLIQ